MPLLLRLESSATERNLLPLKYHTQHELWSNYRTFSIIIVLEQCPVNLAVQRLPTASVIKTQVFERGAYVNWVT